eukprot:Em0006g262a
MIPSCQMKNHLVQIWHPYKWCSTQLFPTRRAEDSPWLTTSRTVCISMHLRLIVLALAVNVEWKPVFSGPLTPSSPPLCVWTKGGAGLSCCGCIGDSKGTSPHCS